MERTEIDAMININTIFNFIHSISNAKVVN